MYRKPTHTGRYLNASSHHHSAQKRDIITTLTTRARRICEEDEIKNELKILSESLETNGYDKRAIREGMKQKTKPASPDDQDIHKHCAFLPYIQNTTDRISRLLKKHNIKTISRQELN